MHRIVDVDQTGLYYKGDVNAETDQVGSCFPPVKAEWIAVSTDNWVATADDPGIYSYCWRRCRTQRFADLLGVLAAVLWRTKSLNQRKSEKEALQKSQLYFLGGAAFAALRCPDAYGKPLLPSFGVEDNPGVLMGAMWVGAGHFRELTLAELKNEGLSSLYYAVPRSVVDTSAECLSAEKGDTAEVIATLNAKVPGTTG